MLRIAGLSKLNASNANLYDARGRLHHKLGQNERALQDYQRAPERNPGIYRSHLDLGVLYLKQKDYQRSLHHFDRVVALKPKLYAAYQNRGIVYLQLKEYQAAPQNFDRALALKPASAQVYQLRGDTYKALQKYQRAINRPFRITMRRLPLILSSRMHCLVEA
ncbi:MAG: tetratricopeptide repeat protein [Ktedonobacteraceae bacterium]|nr:tetratricopeptide repeat protein [Chloroflexota bacterium]